MQLDEERRVDAMEEKVEEVLGFIERVKPSSLFSKDADSAEQLNLSDSASTRIEGYEGREKGDGFSGGEDRNKGKKTNFSPT